jgi:two-component system chemotaxis response regulator CheY
MDPKMKILVVDDFATMRKVVRNMLRQLGCENVSEAENGEEGFRKAQTEEFGLIVSDWNMPVMSGLEFLKAVRAEEKTKTTPFLMVTAEALKENIIQAIQSGASNYIVKPFTPQVFEEKLKAIFKD